MNIVMKIAAFSFRSSQCILVGVMSFDSMYSSQPSMKHLNVTIVIFSCTHKLNIFLSSSRNEHEAWSRHAHPVWLSALEHFQ